MDSRETVFFPSRAHVRRWQNVQQDNEAMRRYEALSEDSIDKIRRFVPLPTIVWDTLEVSKNVVLTGEVPEGVFVGTVPAFVQKFPAVALQTFLSREYVVPESKIDCLVSIIACSSLVVYVPAGFVVDAPIELATLRAYADSLCIEEIVVIIDIGAVATVHDMVDSKNNAALVVVRSVRCFVRDYARLTYLYSQHWRPEVIELSSFHLYQHKAAHTDFAALITGGFFSNIDLNIYLRGDDAQVVTNAAYLLSEKQSVAFTARQLHYAQRTKSDMQVKGILGGQSQALFCGTIFIDVHAIKTDAKQENKNILLHDQARAHSIPNLEVLNNEVYCAHGSAVGPFDAYELWYAQTRGIELKIAKRIFLQGFVDNLFDNFPLLYDKLSEKINKLNCL